MRYGSTWIAGISILGAACAPMGLESASAPAGGYRYALTAQSAWQCAEVQSRLSAAKAASDSEWSRYHKAMAMTWAMVAEQLGGADAAVSSSALDNASIDRLAEMARPCEVISRINPLYSDASFAIEESEPPLFADNAARKFQTGGEPAELPRKQLSFANWEFESRGNSCIARHGFPDGALLTLSFTNFFDGAITLEADALPAFDSEADDYEEQFVPHSRGVARDRDSYAAALEAGVTYKNFTGTAIFVDGQIIAALNPNSGSTSGTTYRFGEAIQKPYYNPLAEGRVLTIKVLGKEKYRLNLTDPAFWNEFSNCVAQYPFG